MTLDHALQRLPVAEAALVALSADSVSKEVRTVSDQVLDLLDSDQVLGPPDSDSFRHLIGHPHPDSDQLGWGVPDNDNIAQDKIHRLDNDLRV